MLKAVVYTCIWFCYAFDYTGLDLGLVSVSQDLVGLGLTVLWFQ